MRLTHFGRLRHALARFSPGEGISLLASELGDSQLPIDPDELIFGSAGIYFLRPDGALTRVVFFRADQDIDDREFSQMLGSQFHHGGFDQDEVVNALRPYHLVECASLVQDALKDWPGEHCITQRGDGRVGFSYTQGGHGLLDVEGQRLRPCPDCLERLNKRRRAGDHFDVESFNPGLLYSESFERASVGSVVQDLGCRKVPDVLRNDWARIEARYLELCEYQCQGEACPHPDLSDPSHHAYLNLHYEQSDPDAPQFGYVRSLCLGCHSRLPGHAYVRQRPIFKRYEAWLSSLSGGSRGGGEAVS